MKRAAITTLALVTVAGAASPAAPAPGDDGPRNDRPRNDRIDDDLTALGYRGDDAFASPDTPCAGAADGSELVGKKLGDWQLADWANTGGKPLSLARLRGRVVVVRFWTTGCGWCEKSLPALQKLSQELRGQPVTFVGAFHGKPASSEPDLTRPRQAIREWNITYPLAIDRDWRTLRAWWLEPGHRHATSVTFVIGKDGRVVHVHPGPVYFPSDDPDDAEANRDYLALRAAIVKAARR
jgi:thiol-disulfide isomerase/thioredoxin